MTNETLKLKVKQRLNKLDSSDYDNIMPWQIIEAFNKGQSNWCRRNLVGTNVSKIGDEGNTRRIDDLQVLLTSKVLNLSKKDLFYISGKLPNDYFMFKRISAKAKKECCDNRRMMIYLGQEGNVEELLRDFNKKPSFEWSETFATFFNNKIKIFTNNDFTVEEAELMYYRQPRKIQMLGISDPYSGTVSLSEQICEFKDDMVELFIDECVKIISGDIQDSTSNQIADNSVETNN
jgi:hypothetical protein